MLPVVPQHPVVSVRTVSADATILTLVTSRTFVSPVTTETSIFIMSDKQSDKKVEGASMAEDAAHREGGALPNTAAKACDSKESDEESSPKKHNKENEKEDDDDEDIDSDDEYFQSKSEDKSEVDPEVIAQNELIESSTPTTPLEIALTAMLKRKDAHIQRITGEISKLKKFVSKRKQTYKRKRKDEGAPTRALSAYNIFIQDRFAKLAKENEKALKSEDTDAELKRVPPSNLVASTGNAWKELPPELKAQYYER